MIFVGQKIIARRSVIESQSISKFEIRRSILYISNYYYYLC
jgi:hypothetical protein